MLNRVPLSLELREESPLHSSSQWSPHIVLPPLPRPIPRHFQITYWWVGFTSLPAGWWGVRGAGGRWWWWCGGMSGSLLRRLQEAGLWLDLRQHLCNRSSLSQIHIYGFPANYPRFSSGGKFSAWSFQIFTHIVPAFFLLMLLIRARLCVSTSFFPPLDCDCMALPNDNCSHDLIVYM